MRGNVAHERHPPIGAAGDVRPSTRPPRPARLGAWPTPSARPPTRRIPLASPAHARLRGALAARPGWRSLPPQHIAAAGEWRASAYDGRGGANGSRMSATGASEDQAVSRLAAMLLAPGG